MTELRDKHISAYVEARVVVALRKFAKENGMTVSQAIRRLVIQGIRLERRRKAAADAVVTELFSGKAG